MLDPVLSYHFILYLDSLFIWYPLLLHLCLVIPWNIQFKILYALCNHKPLKPEMQQNNMYLKIWFLSVRKVPVSHYTDELVNAVCENMHQSHSPVQGHYFLLSFPNVLPISLHFSVIDCYFSIFCLPLPSFCHPIPSIQKACHNTVHNPHSLWTVQHSLFGSELLSVVMCILNAESPQFYSMYKYVGCSEGLEYKRRNLTQCVHT